MTTQPTLTGSTADQLADNLEHGYPSKERMAAAAMLRSQAAEIDRLKAELKKEEDAHDADVNDLNYHLRKSISNHKQAEDELNALQKQVQEQALQIISLIGQEIDYTGLRKAAQMALDSITGADYIDCDQHDAANALRGELGQ